MKEAYGGLTNIYIFMIFFVIYVCFLAVALNFAKTYRIKNYVISTLEQGQFEMEDINKEASSAVWNRLERYLKSVPYNIENKEIATKCNAYGDGAVSRDGVCIVPRGSADSPYYMIVVFFKIEFPFLGIDGFYMPISGETMIIHQPSSS